MTPPSQMSQQTTCTYQTGFYRFSLSALDERQFNCGVTSGCKGVTLQTAFAKRNSKKMCVQRILNSARPFCRSIFRHEVFVEALERKITHCNNGN